jgi:predicted oxidoreductase
MVTWRPCDFNRRAVNVTYASQLAKVYNWHKYYLQISITTSDKTSDYRRGVSTLLAVGWVGTGGASTDGHNQSTLRLCPL